MKYQEIKDFPCNAPKGSIAVTVPDGYVKPCCAFQNQTDDWKETSNLFHTNSFDDILTSHHWNNYVPDEHCISCIHEEEHIGPHKLPISLREHWNLEISDDANKLEYLELALDFTCNMMCRMCGPRQSSKWNASPILKDLQKFSTFDKIYYDKVQNIFIENYNSGENELYNKQTGLKEYSLKLMSNLTNTDLSNLKVVKLIGGEPLYSKKLPQFINLLKKQEHWRDIKIILISNGSIIPDEVLFKGFRDIEIQVSIDAIGDLGSTIRMKQPWDKIDNNIRAMNDLYNVTMLHATVSIMNINKMQDFLDYCHELDIEESMSMLHGPNYLRLNIIPREFRMQWLTDNDKVNTWLMIPNHKDSKDQGQLFLRSIPLLDSESEFNFRDINPEIVDIVEKYVV